MTAPILYHTLASPASWPVRMLALYIGLELELHNIQMLKMEHKADWFEVINPMGTLPAMQDGPFNISESHTINQYLLRKYAPEYLEELYPSDLEARALVDQAMYFDTGVAFIRVKNICLPTFLYGQENINQQLLYQVNETYAIMERYLSKNKFAAGDHITVADIGLSSTFSTIQYFIPVDGNKYPLLLQWLNIMQSQDFFKAVFPEGIDALGKAVRYYWDLNKKNNAADSEVAKTSAATTAAYLGMGLPEDNKVIKYVYGK